VHRAQKFLFLEGEKAPFWRVLEGFGLSLEFIGKNRRNFVDSPYAQEYSLSRWRVH
jgi:hypothetical protein